MKPERVWRFYQSLRGRGMSLTKLAAKLQTTHTHLSQVVTGSRGAHTRKHIARHLTREETDILGWEERGEFVPQGTMSQVEQLAERQTHG